MTIKLPRTITSDVMKEKNLVITISGEDIIYFNNKIFTVKELPSELHKYIPASPSILIKTDRRASVGRIVDVWDICRTLGIEKINIAANQIN